MYFMHRVLPHDDINGLFLKVNGERRAEILMGHCDNEPVPRSRPTQCPNKQCKVNTKREWFMDHSGTCA